jgi:plastocyanin
MHEGGSGGRASGSSHGCVRGLAAVTACAALCLAAGCGESSSGGSSASASGAGAATSTTGGANGAGAGAGGAGANAHGSSAKSKAIQSGGIKPNTTPKFAAPSKSAAVQSGAVKVEYRNISIDPDTLRVKVGTTVKWTNYDEGIEHNVTSEGGPDHFASKNFGAGASVEFKLTKPGVVHYECTNHPTTMNGTIEVVG